MSSRPRSRARTRSRSPHDLLPREREIAVAGGLIRYLREQQPATA